MYESPIILFKTDPLIQCVKNETDTMVIQGVARAGVHVDKDELIKALEYDRGQYEKGFHDGRMYVPPCPSNADRIRAMSRVNAQYYDEMDEEWSIRTVTVEDVLYGVLEELPPTIIGGKRNDLVHKLSCRNYRIWNVGYTFRPESNLPRVGISQR